MLDLDMTLSDAIAFVRDVPRSLSHAGFLRDLQVLAGEPATVAASLPVNAAFFGQHEVPFRSELHETDAGARLVPRTLTPEGPGWAEVSGEVVVQPVGMLSRVHYTFAITIHLALPTAERWGGHALRTMIRFTAATVLEGVTARFPEAVRAAARESIAAA